MINHIGPQAAVTLGQQLATRYQIEKQLIAGDLVNDLMAQIEPVLAVEGNDPVKYLGTVRGRLKMDAETSTDARRSEFMNAAIAALTEKLESL